jgi:hypothetical protein
LWLTDWSDSSEGGSEAVEEWGLGVLDLGLGGVEGEPLAAIDLGNLEGSA